VEKKHQNRVIRTTQASAVPTDQFGGSICLKRKTTNEKQKYINTNKIIPNENSFKLD